MPARPQFGRPQRYSYRVSDMTSARSASAITDQVKAIDGDAVVRIDVGRHRVDIVPVRAQAGELREAIRRAGFTPDAMSVR